MSREREGAGRLTRPAFLMTLAGGLVAAGIVGCMAWGMGGARDVAYAEAGGTGSGAGTSGETPTAVELYAQATPQQSGSCLLCHTDADLLEQVKSSDDIDAALYLVNPAFAETTHGLLGCTYCHGGDAEAADRATAMEGITVRPSADVTASVCADCHVDEAQNVATSLHYTTAGLECAYQTRLAVASEDAGVDLAAANFQSAGCPDCHADCGQCHVRNASMNQFGVEYTGLIDGHMFVDATDNGQIMGTCLSCHAGSITTCFTESDVHGFSGLNMNCMDCHDLGEIHGDGNAYTTMVGSGAVRTECEDCHAAETLAGEWHSSAHLEANECWACHTVAYNTCTSCHGWYAESRGDAPFQMTQCVALGLNPADGKITTLVKAPVDAGMLGDAGIELTDEQINTQSSLWPGFVHGVIVPELSQQFCDRCHGAGTALVKADDLQFPDWETSQLVEDLPEVDAGQYIA